MTEGSVGPNYDLLTFYEVLNEIIFLHRAAKYN